MSRDAGVGVPVRQMTMFKVTAKLDQRSALRWIVEKHFKPETPVNVEKLIEDLDAYTSAKYRDGFEQGREAAWSAI